MGQHKKSGLNQRQWLNVIIIVMSAAFLLFVLLGKMLNQAADKQQAPAESSQLELQKIDFGDFQVAKKDGQWQSIKKEVGGSDLIVITRQWQLLLNQMEKNTDSKLTLEKPELERTVLLYVNYFPQPIVCKLIQFRDKLEIVFVNSNTKFIFPAESIFLYYPQ